MSEQAENDVETGSDNPAPKRGVGRGRGAGSRSTQFGRRPQPDRTPPAEVVYEAARPLEDLRFVLTRPKRADKSPGQHAARKLLERDYRGFVGMLTKLEDEERVARGNGPGGALCPRCGGPAAEAPIEDHGAARVGILIEDLLREFSSQGE